MNAGTAQRETRSAAFEPVEEIDGNNAAGVILVCDHASNAVPEEYAGLGLSAAALARHIAYDIGAAWVTRRVAALLGAPAVLSTFSRLLIDPNRGADDPTLVMKLSDGAIVPGNAKADAAEIEKRRATYWAPYREAIARRVDAMIGAGAPPALVSIHSFTPVWRGVPRPWKVGILWDKNPRLAQPLLDSLGAEPDLAPVGDNEPYDGALEGDTIDAIATARGLSNALIELRQDLIAARADAEAFAARLAGVIAPILANEEARRPMDWGSRARIEARSRG